MEITLEEMTELIINLSTHHNEISHKITLLRFNFFIYKSHPLI